MMQFERLDVVLKRKKRCQPINVICEIAEILEKGSDESLQILPGSGVWERVTWFGDVAALTELGTLRDWAGL